MHLDRQHVEAVAKAVTEIGEVDDLIEDALAAGDFVGGSRQLVEGRRNSVEIGAGDLGAVEIGDEAIVIADPEPQEAHVLASAAEQPFVAGVDRRGLVLDTGDNGRIVIVSVADSGRPSLPAIFLRPELRQVPALRHRFVGDDVVPDVALFDGREDAGRVGGVGIGGLQEAAPGRGFHQDVDHLEIFRSGNLCGDLPIAEDVHRG